MRTIERWGWTAVKLLYGFGLAPTQIMTGSWNRGSRTSLEVDPPVDTGDLPQTFNSFDYVVSAQGRNVFEWILLGDESEWSFTAPYPAVENCDS